jgi:hypothetical protein
MRVLIWFRTMFAQYAPGLARVLPWVGGALMLVGAGYAARSWSFARTQERAMATVTENVSEFAPKGGVVYRPKLRFMTAKGELVQVVAADRSEDVEFAAGDMVPVMYRAGSPQEAIIATVGRAYFWGILFGVMGVVVFDVGLILRLKLKMSVA